MSEDYERDMAGIRSDLRWILDRTSRLPGYLAYAFIFGALAVVATVAAVVVLA